MEKKVNAGHLEFGGQHRGVIDAQPGFSKVMSSDLGLFPERSDQPEKISSVLNAPADGIYFGSTSGDDR